MENKAHAMAAGIFVVALTALLLGLAAWLTRDTGVRDTYEISTKETVTGLQEQAPVRYRGVDVGKVSAIGFDRKAPGNVLIRLQVERAAPLTRGTFATLSYQGVTGLSFIQLDDDGKQPTRLQPDDDNPPRIPLRPSLIAKLEEKGEAILERVDEVAARINRVLNDENQKRVTALLANTSQAADSVNQLAQRLDTTLQKRVDPALAEAATTLKSVKNSSEEIGRTAADFGATARRLNETGGPMDRLAEGTQALSHAADSFNAATLPRINRVTDEAGRAVRLLGRTVNNINDNPQSLIFGAGKVDPGPGEPGFAAPGGAR
jgi:phospholipid/cholesterol/gamma-HCH transport system substrate-binding protein